MQIMLLTSNVKSTKLYHNSYNKINNNANI